MSGVQSDRPIGFALFYGLGSGRPLAVRGDLIVVLQDSGSGGTVVKTNPSTRGWSVRESFGEAVASLRAAQVELAGQRASGPACGQAAAPHGTVTPCCGH